MAVAAVAVAATSVECHAAASLVAEWARLMAPAGAAIGTGAATGTAPVVIGGIRTAVGVGGMAIDGVTQGIMWSSLAVLAFPGGGVGAGVHGLAGDGATRMDITGTVTRTYGSGYYGYGNGYGAEYQYGQYGNSSQSRVAELQRRLQRAGYYHGSVDGVLGPQTRSAIRAYEQDHGDVG